MLNSSTQTSLQHATGEELLMLAILAPSNLKPNIDRELDRRALADVVTSHAVLHGPFTEMPEYAA